jgi:RNA polymerase sigma factor (sigma-70 family)
MSSISKEKKLISQNEDLELLDRISNGEQLAYKKLQEKYHKIISSLIRKMIQDEDDIDDLTQEAFIKAFSNLEKFDKSFNFSSWLFRIASNHCIDFLRKKRFQTVSIDQSVSNDEDEQYIEIKDDSYQPEISFLNQERINALNEAIDSLPENYRVIIKLRHEEDMDYQDIANELDLPLGTVKAHLFRARKSLLQILKSKNDLFVA